MMCPADEIDEKRALLLSAKIRFSPETQAIKETVLEKMIENVLSFSPDQQRMNVENIQKELIDYSGGFHIRLCDISAVAKSLVERGLATEDNKKRYALSDSRKNEIRMQAVQVDQQFKRIVGRLFRDAPGSSKIYLEPFRSCIFMIFGKLGEECTRIVTGLTKEDRAIGPEIIQYTLGRIKKYYPGIDSNTLEAAIVSFFDTIDPDFNEYRWRIAQNIFVSKIIGMDSASKLLSKEIFQNATVYLDTNIIIAGLEPSHRINKTFVLFAKACKRLGLKIIICQISINELRGWVQRQKELIKTVVDQIPHEMTFKVDSPFYEKYLSEKQGGAEPDIDHLFQVFDNPIDSLGKLCSVDLEDDKWFITQEQTSTVRRLSKMLRERYREAKHKEKTPNSASHDALLLLWAAKNKLDSNRDIWVVTADTTLPGAIVPTIDMSMALSLDAFLQWVSPLYMSSEEEGELSSVFSELLRLRLLPQDRFFVLEDFVIFHDMKMICKNLPPKDVEDCIRYIKKKAPGLNPYDPKDRETLIYEVTKFFASPDRKFKEEISKLEGEKEQVKQRYELLLGEARSAFEMESSKLEDNLSTKDYEIGQLEIRVKQMEDEKKHEKIRRAAHKKAYFALSVILLIEFILFIAVKKYGQGENLLQKISNTWGFFAGCPAVVSSITYFFFTKEELQILSAPIAKLFKLHE